MEADGVRSTPARDEHLVPGHLRARQLAVEPEHECIETFVGGEDVRAEPDDEDVEAVVAREPQRGGQLLNRARSDERPRGSTGADRRQLRERNALLEADDHAGSPSTTARATLHGSPTPSVTTTSPDRTHDSASAAASSSVGAHPRL